MTYSTCLTHMDKDVIPRGSPELGPGHQVDMAVGIGWRCVLVFTLAP